MVPCNPCFDQAEKGSLTLRSTFVSGKAGEIVYDEGRDYVIDYAMGSITRTTDSRIPDYSTHCLWGQNDFDHCKFPESGNLNGFVWADYRSGSRIS